MKTQQSSLENLCNQHIAGASRGILTPPSCWLRLRTTPGADDLFKHHISHGCWRNKPYMYLYRCRCFKWFFFPSGRFGRNQRWRNTGLTPPASPAQGGAGPSCPSPEGNFLSGFSLPSSLHHHCFRAVQGAHRAHRCSPTSHFPFSWHSLSSRIIPFFNV